MRRIDLVGGHPGRNLQVVRIQPDGLGSMCAEHALALPGELPAPASARSFKKYIA
jgi:hypothetical protein